jgi:hypothetical protein
VSSDSGEPRIVVVPADPEIEASCEYAREVIDRQLIADTERLMTEPERFVGIDFAANANGDDFSVATLWSPQGVTTGRLSSKHPNVSALPRTEPVDYLPLLVQSSATSALDNKKFMEELKELSKDFKPIQLQECKGLKPGELYVAQAPGDVGPFKVGKIDSFRIVDALVEETERKMLGIQVHEMTATSRGFGPKKFGQKQRLRLELLHSQMREERLINETEEKMLGTYVDPFIPGVDFASLELRTAGHMMQVMSQDTSETLTVRSTWDESVTTWREPAIRELWKNEYLGMFVSPEKDDDEPA